MKFIKYIYRYFRDRDTRKKKESDMPWVEIISIETDPSGNPIFKLDWNDAFINNIKKAGFTGIRDEELIDKYLYTLFSNAVDDYELTSVTNLAR